MQIPAYSALDPARQRLARQIAEEKVRSVLDSVPGEMRELEKELRRRRCAVLRNFVEYFWDVVEPEVPLRWNWHLDELCEVLRRVESGETGKVIINVPPGTMKSLLISVFFRAYVWSKDPSKRFLAGSYGSTLSVRDNVKLRSIVSSRKYQDLFPLRLTGDQNVKEKFETTRGGWSIATSVGGAGTGEHPDFAIIDDPLTEQQSRSEADRNAANTWIDRTLSTRGVTRGMRTMLVMQRLHEEDPTGHLLAKGGWEHVVFPMRYEVRKHQKQDRRTVPGELLWPELFPEEKVRSLEMALGPYSAAGQLQQRPAPEGGGLFKREWFRFCEAAPSNARRVRCWDTAATEGSGDYTAGAKLCESRDVVYVEHVVRGQWSPAGVDAVMKQYALLDGVQCAVKELQEPASSGKTVIAARTKALKGFAYGGVQVNGDKVTMAKPFRAQCEAGNVLLVRTGDAERDAWIEPFLAELSTFPTGTHDDQVDAASNAYNALLLEPVPQAEYVVW